MTNLLYWITLDCIGVPNDLMAWLVSFSLAPSSGQTLEPKNCNRRSQESANSYTHSTLTVKVKWTKCFDVAEEQMIN